MIRLTTYNCCSIRNKAEQVKKILDRVDILFLQEIMLSKGDIHLLDEFHRDFDHAAFVLDKESEGINEGRPRGIAFFFAQMPLIIYCPSCN